MCGIVGFTGEHQAAPILLDGLSKLEYRGYDVCKVSFRTSFPGFSCCRNSIYFGYS